MSSRRSLLAGRHKAPLSPTEITRAYNTFLGLDDRVSFRYEESACTHCDVGVDDNGQEYAEIIYGPYVYPGSGVIDPNSSLSLVAAAAHELTHYYRWRDKTELSDPALRLIDEALTSLGAIVRYQRSLSVSDISQLVSDANTRLQLFVEEQAGARVQASPRQ